jgi:hypothetical protein
MRIAIALLAVTAGCALAAPKPDLLEDGFREMYNLDFRAAHDTFRNFERLHPQDPMGPVSDAAAYLFSEFDRLQILQTEFFVEDSNFKEHTSLTPDPHLKQAFDAALQRGQQLADRALAANPGDKNATFAKILRLGLHADYLALIEKSYLPSLGEMKDGRIMAEQLVASDPSYYDAYLAIGVENYLLSLKPAPVRWLLRISGAQTDRDVGLERLRLTAEKGRYLKPFARLLLAVAALREHRNDRARMLLAQLASEFPHNRLYTQELARLE